MSQQNLGALQKKFSIVASIASNLYAVSGVVLFILIPIVLWATSLSLQSVYQFSEVRYWLRQPIGKVLVMATMTLCFYCSVAGIYLAGIHASTRLSNQSAMLGMLVFTITLLFGIFVGYCLC